MMGIKMGGIKLGGGDEYPEFYEELDKQPSFKAGDEIPATIRIKSLTESVKEDGTKCWAYEGCVTEIKGKTTQDKKPKKYASDMEEIEEAMGDEEENEKE